MFRTEIRECCILLLLFRRKEGNGREGRKERKEGRAYFWHHDVCITNLDFP
jgi:hypothetical protein